MRHRKVLRSLAPLSLLVLLAAAACSGTSDAADEAGDGDGDGDGDDLGDGDGDLSTGGNGSGGAGDGTGAAPSGGSPNGSGGGGQVITGAAHVFVGITEGQILAYEMSETDGALTAAGQIAAASLDFVTMHAPSRTLFVSGGAGVAAFTYDPEENTFTPGATADTSGGGTHVAVNAEGNAILIAHYSQNGTSFFNFSSGAFDEESWADTGNNAHQARFRGDFAYVPCLGSPHVAQYQLSGAAGARTLEPLDPANVFTGGGPRHMDFHPTESVAYVIAELSSAVHVFDINVATGTLTARPDDSVFTHEDEGGHWSSDIKVAPNGKYLYAVNRNAPESDSDVVLFTISESDQTLTRVSATPVTGEVRSFGMDPKGKFLQVGSKSGLLQTFSIDEESGALTPGPSLTSVGTINNTEIHYL